MPLSDKLAEIQRLIEAFEVEAGRFHDLRLETFSVDQNGTIFDRKFDPQHHAIMLWQYYGTLEAGNAVTQFMTDVKESDLKWGLRGAALSVFGVIEGEACQRFVNMAIRAGTLFNAEEARVFKSRVVAEIQEREKVRFPSAKSTAVMNDNPLAIWLNYLLYHLSLTNPGRERNCRINPEPFSLSLLALERLSSDQTIGKADRSSRPLSDLRFKVALSFPGDKRRFVSRVVEALRGPLGKDALFYDFDYQAQLARPNLDILLQQIYVANSELIVVFLCAEYARKQWCGLEWRAIRDIIKSKSDEQIMFIRFDDAKIDGLLSIDGFIDARVYPAKQVAEFILARVQGPA